jgi:GDP-L-fucose synthase
MHSSDLAEGVLYLLNSEYVGPIVNIGTGHEITIKELAASVSKIIGYTGLVRWDSSYPDGAPRKLLDSSIIQALGWRPTVTLDEGIAREYRQYQQDI